MSFFRRLRRDKEEPSAETPPKTSPGDPEIAPSDENTTGSTARGPEEPTSPPLVETSALASGPTPVPELTPSAPNPPPAAGVPPPLPGPDPASPRSPSAPAIPFALCFVCGTPLEGKYCPTCRMTWVE